jgi:hypothetical protein
MDERIGHEKGGEYRNPEEGSQKHGDQYERQTGVARIVVRSGLKAI